MTTQAFGPHPRPANLPMNLVANLDTPIQSASFEVEVYADSCRYPCLPPPVGHSAAHTDRRVQRAGRNAPEQRPCRSVRAFIARDRQRLLLDAHLLQDEQLLQSHQTEPPICPDIPQSHPPAGDCRRYQRLSAKPPRNGPPRNVAPLERSAQTASSEALTRLEQRLTWLATIASTSTFVGLFGTVMGIVDAFHGLGTAGSATLRAVAPGISEALITTAAGIFVAVPAAIAYNQFTARLRIFASGIDDFARELLNSLEEIPQRSAAPQATAQGQRAMTSMDREV